MTIELQDTAIMIYLKSKGLMYHGKVLELREVIEGWLAYIPNTFPHYTRHTVRHSDEIVRQISKLLFRDEDPSQTVLPLTAVEAYLVIAAAYLHDAGMVVSDKEKLELLQTDEWQSWVSDSNGGAKRWYDIQALRNGNEPSDGLVRNFLADLETRFLRLSSFAVHIISEPGPRSNNTRLCWGDLHSMTLFCSGVLPTYA